MARQTRDDDYYHQKQMSQLEEMNKDLLKLQEQLHKTSVRCAILQVDLATQFNPHIIETIRNTNDAMRSCADAINKLGEPESNESNVQEENSEPKVEPEMLQRMDINDTTDCSSS